MLLTGCRRTSDLLFAANRLRTAFDKPYRIGTELLSITGCVGVGIASAGAAAAPELPEKLLEQLAPGGRLIMPVGPSGSQNLVRVERFDDRYEQVDLGGVSFVPLVKGK